MAETQRSVTLTVAVYFGMAVIAVGIVMLFMGLQSGATELEVLGGKFKSASAGALLVFVGAGLIAVIAKKLPDDVVIFSPTTEPGQDWLVHLALPAALVAVAALVIWIVTLVQ